MSDPVVVKTPLRVRLVIAKGAKPLISPSVVCPRTHESVDASSCTKCPRLSLMTWDLSNGGFVTCAGGDSIIPTRPARMDLSEAAARAPMHTVIRPVTTCVHADTSIGDARGLLRDRDTRALPVVDGALKVIGIITRSDMMSAAPDAVVADLMTLHVHTVAEGAPVSEAIALMAAEDISEVPVVTATGEIIGMWYALDAIRWTAERFGYVFPAERPSVTVPVVPAAE